MRGWPMSRPHRPRRRRLSFRVPSRSPAPALVVSRMPICAVARARAARCSPPLPPARPCHVPWLAHVSPAPPSASAELGAQLGAHRLEASGAPHEISRDFSSALSSAPNASKPAGLLTRSHEISARRSARRPTPRSQRGSSRDLTRFQRAMSRASGSRAAAWLRCQR
jgi:hypothetical protein